MEEGDVGGQKDALGKRGRNRGPGPLLANQERLGLGRKIKGSWRGFLGGTRGNNPKETSEFDTEKEKNIELKM